MKNFNFKILVFFISFCYSTKIFSQAPLTNDKFSEVSAREYYMDFTTYPFSDPDPVANFSKIYPYFRYDGFTETPIQKKWKVIELENDFIKILILPEIGGKIWTAIDKKTNQSFIYYNHTVKFRDVALRGPWTSGGIEANYGIIGHTPNCATPVDYIISKKEDQSISCYIGVLDLLTQTQWRLEINMPKDKAYFTTQSFWYNGTSTEQPYYHWMNVGLKVKGNLEYIYPGTNYLGHEGEYSDWPINKTNGKNISFYENNNFGGYKSYHVFGKYTNFFGGYWHDDNFGMVRFAQHDEKAGKKIWIWGLSRQGMIWEKYLTDTDGQYTEVQSGRLFNQNAEKSTFTPFKHYNFLPYNTDIWKEYWYGVSKTNGMVEANKSAALNMIQQNGSLKILLYAVENIDDTLKIKVDNKIIYSKKIQIKAASNFSDSILYTHKSEPYTVTLGSSTLQYNSDANSNTLNRPIASPSSINWNSSEGLYIQGKELMDQKLNATAQEKLTASLQKDSNYVPSLIKMASLLLQQHQYNKALQLAKRALSIDAHDGAANYYYGIINAQLKNYVDAKDGLDIASLSVAYRSAAFTELAKIYFIENNLQNVIEYCDKAISYNMYNITALQLKVMAYRYLKNESEYFTTIQLIKKYDPLNHFVNFENYYFLKLKNNSSNELAKAKEDFIQLIKNELPVETYLQIANEYLSIGLYEEAQSIVQLCPSNNLVSYYEAYILHLRGMPYLPSLQKAETESAAFVFPFRNTDIDIFEWASNKTEDWKPKYYLGLLYKDRNRVVEAKQLFDKINFSAAYAPFYAARAALYNSEKKDPLINNKIESDLKKAIEIDSSSWRYVKALAEFYNNQANYSKSLFIISNYYNKHTNNYIIGMLYAKTLILNNKYNEADELLNTLNIIPFEGATKGHELYREVKLMQALNQIQQQNYNTALSLINVSKLWPENLGAGKPYDEDIDIRLENWLSYICFKKLKMDDSAKQMLNTIIHFEPHIKNTVSNYYLTNHIISLKAYQELKQSSVGQKWLTHQITTNPSLEKLKIIQQTSLDLEKINFSKLLLAFQDDLTLKILKNL